MNTSSGKNVHAAVDDRITVRMEVMANGCGVPIFLIDYLFYLVRSKEDTHLVVGLESEIFCTELQRFVFPLSGQSFAICKEIQIMSGI